MTEALQKKVDFAINVEQEIWKDIDGYEGLYQVSNRGRVKSLPRKVRCAKGWTITPERILVGGVSNGYRHYLLHSSTGIPRDLRANRLVATAFIPNPLNLPYVNHKDENRGNDCVDNLEWCTPKYNVNYGTAPMRRRQNDSKIKAVCQYDMDGNLIAKFRSINEAKRAIGASHHTTIVQCCQHLRMSFKGYIWLYESDSKESLNEIVRRNRESSNFHRVMCIDRESNKQAIYGTITEAVRATGLSREIIKARMDGRVIDRKYIWKQL